MRFSIHLNQKLGEQLEAVTQKMRDWENLQRMDSLQTSEVRHHIQPFTHTTQASDLVVGAIDGSGEYPLLTYSDAFIYLTLAHGVVYKAESKHGLREVDLFDPVMHLAWIPEDKNQGPIALEEALEALAGMSLREVIGMSDYRDLKAQEGGGKQSVDELYKGLVRPHASDSGNLAIQLRTTGELGAALKLIRSDQAPRIVLVDTTSSLPLVGSSSSLFYEHLKRLCAVEALERSIGFMALSKSHGMPGMEQLETLAREVLGSPGVAEHWYLRVPVPDEDGWELPLAEGRRVPPPGAVSYLVRFHRSIPVMRLDLDRAYWQRHIQGDTPQQTLANEQQLFGALDYMSHDQRSYGYPYPLKAAHDRASLTQEERVALRKQVIDQAVAAGLRPNLFRDAAQLTGHR